MAVVEPDDVLVAVLKKTTSFMVGVKSRLGVHAAMSGEGQRGGVTAHVERG